MRHIKRTRLKPIAAILMSISALVAIAVLLTSFPTLAPRTADADSARDSLKRNPFDRTIVGSEPASNYSPRQDTTYSRGKRLRVPPATRFKRDMSLTDSAWREEQRRRSNTLEGLMQHNLAITPLDLIPSERQRMDHDRQLHPGAPSDVFPVFPRAGITVNFDTRTLLGLDEDVSPAMSYNVPHATHVRILIFTAKGDTVAQLFEGTQVSGKHSIVWNTLDRNGNDVPAGDYVLEVLVDTDRRFTKRIVVM